MKKKILYIAAVVICLSIISGGTFAYYTAADTARNVVTTSGVGVEVVEEQLQGGVLAPYPAEPIPVMPSDEVSKVVSARSTEEAAWVRMRYSITVYDAAGMPLPIPEEELARAILITPDTAGWTYSAGWWYYNTALAAGSVSTPLFEKVVFSGPEMGNQYQLCTAVIDVTAQAVQKAHNGKTALEALGWPET